MEPLYFAACEEVDTFFREGREFFNTMFVKKLAQVSTYFTRLPERTWPLNTGTSQTGFRFGRGFYDPTRPWRAITSGRCELDSCDVKADIIRRPGSEKYSWELIKKEMQTPWFCVEDMMYRLFPITEIEQMVKSQALITRSVHEEIARTTYVGASGHKWTAFVNEDNEYCEAIDDEAWFLDTYNENQIRTAAILGVVAPQDPAYTGYDSRYIYVKGNWNATGGDVDFLSKIATLSLDTLGSALVDLGDEDEAYRIDLRDAGILKMDIILPDEKTAYGIFKQAKEANGFWNANTDFDMSFTNLRLGRPRTVGDYAFSYDSNALRYNADTAYNAALVTASAEGYLENDPDTWFRLVRVMRYYEVSEELGYSYKPDPDYKRADFGVSIHWMNDVLTKWRNPSWTGTGEVQMQSQNYAGDFNFRRPIWECNPKGKMGYFDAEFRLAMQVADPTLMHSFLHRLDHSQQHTTSPCTVQSYTPRSAITDYVCQPVAE